MNLKYDKFGLVLVFLFGTIFCNAGNIRNETEPNYTLRLTGNRFLTFNTVIRVNQIEVARDKNLGRDERKEHTPEKVMKFREAIEKGFPGARITWAFSWLALHDTTTNYKKIREFVVSYHYRYGDEITFIPGAYFANAYNSTEQVNLDLHEGLQKVSEMTGNGYRPKSVVAGFLSAANQEYLATKEGIHVCQGNIWSQFAIDNQDGDGSVCYPYYPSKEHFCKPAQNENDFIDCVNLDGWTMDFLAARREGFAQGFNSRMGVGPIETLGNYGLETGLKEMLHTTAIHFDEGFKLNGFAWVTNCWELSLTSSGRDGEQSSDFNYEGLTRWLSEIKKRWPDVNFITQGEFGLIWRDHYKNNDFNYRFEEKGSGIGGSDADKEINWYMNKAFRMAILKDLKTGEETIIDFTRYDGIAKEPESGSTRNWTLYGDINQKQTRKQDVPITKDELSENQKSIISKYYPDLLKSNVIVFGNDKIKLTLDYNGKCNVSKLDVNNQNVISGSSGIYSEIRTSTNTFSTLSLLSPPKITSRTNAIFVSDIIYGEKENPITENWKFTVYEENIILEIEREIKKDLLVEEVSFPSFYFNDINTWNAALLGNGGVAWFYLFNEKLCTYGVHTNYSAFWNNKNNTGLKISSSANGKQIASKYSRSNEDKLAYSISVSDKELVPRYDADTKRRRFIRQKTDVWDSFILKAGKYTQTITLTPTDYSEEYDRGKFVGIDGEKITNLLNTIARIGVIDSKHYGANSWHTPYGPICLHEQYIGLLGIAINDPNYINGYKECLDFYRDNAIKPDGRVFSRWAYDNSDMMKGEVTPLGFYEAQWGYLFDSNTDLPINVCEVFNLSGDLEWVRKHKKSTETVLEYLLKRDTNKNNLVEVMTDSHTEKRGSDWIDIIWASFENAFINAKLYYALVQWSDVEKQLGDNEKAGYYADFAVKLKTSFNKPIEEGGFWDPKNKWYVYWRDKDNSIHGNNLVTPVNFMAIAYGICDDSTRCKAILDKIELQMKMESLFFWPICLFPFQTDEGLDYQYPFPYYENGDLFLSWGSVGVESNAKVNPDLALKYVENILKQYDKDGLAFQRYARTNQQGAGDDILAGNSLSIVGLYKAVYGINPMYNRLYLNPHLSAKLSGTELVYNFRNDKLKIGLATSSYSIASNQFKISSSTDFGFYSSKDELTYFNGNDDLFSLKASTPESISLEIEKWNSDEYSWLQSSTSEKGKVSYTIHVANANTLYTIYDGVKNRNSKSDKDGLLKFEVKTSKNAIPLKVRLNM
jgi:hypothetical protein